MNVRVKSPLDMGCQDWGNAGIWCGELGNVWAVDIAITSGELWHQIGTADAFTRRTKHAKLCWSRGEVLLFVATVSWFFVG
jgi:hypothetical protein